MCPENASCAAPREPALTDAAAYAVGTRAWRPLPAIPVPVAAYEAQAVAVGNAVHVLVTQGKDAGAHLRFDLARRSWERLPPPPDYRLQLVAAGPLVVGYQTSQEGGPVRDDLVYVPQTRRWEALPRDPLAPSFDRALTWTGERLVLTGPKLTRSPNGEDGPSYVRAATLDLTSRTWTRLPDQTQVVSSGLERTWDGDHVVSPYLQTVNGGDTNGFGRDIDTGGLLDVRTGQWAALPLPPPAGAGRYVAVSERWITADAGLVLDTRRMRWIPLPDHDGTVDQGASAAWVGDVLVAWGGGRGSADLVATGSTWSPGL